jgi:hypothetical protein
MKNKQINLIGFDDPLIDEYQDGNKIAYKDYAKGNLCCKATFDAYSSNCQCENDIHDYSLKHGGYTLEMEI